MDVNTGESKETLEVLRTSYNDLLYAMTLVHLHVEQWGANAYGPHYPVMCVMLEKAAKKTAKLACETATRLRCKGGFTFSVRDIRSGRPSPFPEIDKHGATDKHPSETEVLKAWVCMCETIARHAKCIAAVARSDKHKAMADADFFEHIAREYECLALVARGTITSQDLNPPVVNPSDPSKHQCQMS